jgi:hypothetical protein
MLLLFFRLWCAEHLHARHPACDFNRTLVVHLDLSASSVSAVALARHVHVGLGP